MKEQFNKKAAPLPVLLPGTPVVIRDPASRAWVGKGTIVLARRDDKQSFEILMADGTKIIHIRKWVRPAAVTCRDD